MLSYRILAAILLASAVLYLIPFFFSIPARQVILSWAPGYWQTLPRIGLARIVPVSPPRLVSPAVGFGPKTIREHADSEPPKKY